MERACYPLPPPHPLQRRPRRPSPSCWRTRSGGATRPSSPSPSSSPPASTSWSTSSSRWATTACLSNSYFNELSDPERCHLQLPHLSSHRGSLTGGNNTFSRSNKLIHPLSLSFFSLSLSIFHSTFSSAGGVSPRGEPGHRPLPPHLRPADHQPMRLPLLRVPHKVNTRNSFSSSSKSPPPVPVTNNQRQTGPRPQ